jgi:hypothetical protein
MEKISCWIIIFVALPLHVLAANGVLSTAQFGLPFVSEMSGTMNKVDLGYGTNRPEYDISYTGEDYKKFVDLQLGAQIPLYARTFEVDGKPSWGIALSIPFSVHIWEDMWEEVTAPVLNNDYRFGLGTFRYIKYLESDHFIKNIGVNFAPINHECTHIGDELTIYRKDADLPITRVNISYEYSELSITLNDPNGSRETLHSFRLGTMIRISDRGQGWYGLRPEEGDTSVLSVSDKRYEVYGEYQMQRTHGFLASGNVMNVASIEVRSRLKYGYPFLKEEANGVDWEEVTKSERMVPSVNAYFGWRYYPDVPGSAYSNVGLYVNAYQGVNYHGMFRNMKYGYLGLSIVIE